MTRFRPRRHVGQNRQADLLCALQIDDQLKLHRLLDGQVRRLGSFGDFVDIRGRPAV
jgi:hypothetical protein